MLLDRLYLFLTDELTRLWVMHYASHGDIQNLMFWLVNGSIG